MEYQPYFGYYLGKVMQEKNLTLTDLSKILKIKPAVLRFILDAKSGVSYSRALHIARTLKIPLVEFLSKEDRHWILPDYAEGELIRVPLVGCISAGPLDEIEWIEDLGELNIPINWAGKHFDRYFLRVNGTSMLGHGIINGSLVLVEPQQADVRPGSIVIFNQPGEGSTLKIYDVVEGEPYLYASRESGLRPISLNRQISSRIQGVVKMVIVKFNDEGQ